MKTPDTNPQSLLPEQYGNVLSRRADIIVSSLGVGIEQGTLSPDTITTLMQQVTDEHNDLLQVFLGIKPMATHLSFMAFHTSDFYQKDFTFKNYLSHFPRMALTGVPVAASTENYFDDVLSVWNPLMVNDLLASNADLIPPSAANIDARDPSFGSYIEYLSGVGTFASEQILQGVLLGYPRSDSESYVTYYPKLEVLFEQARQASGAEGQPLFMNEETTPLQQLFMDQGNTHAKLLFLARKIGCADDLFTYLQSLRRAQVPGFGFLTSGETTRGFEERQMEDWNASGIEHKLTNLVERYS